jgi:hypothetical protein
VCAEAQKKFVFGLFRCFGPLKTINKTYGMGN